MKLLVLSGHYNTQLGLLAALELDRYQGSDRLPWFTSIPSFAATLTLELHLHEESGAFLVRLVMQVSGRGRRGEGEGLHSCRTRRLRCACHSVLWWKALVRLVVTPSTLLLGMWKVCLRSAGRWQ
jgi:hypothetical protein